mgnify:CR=1 FL=1
MGTKTTASVENQVVMGKYNAANENAFFIIGNGTSKLAKNIFEVGMLDKGTKPAFSLDGIIITVAELEILKQAAQGTISGQEEAY